MNQPLPSWLSNLALVWLSLCFLSSLIIFLDSLLRPRKMMTVMKWVWPINALYLGPFVFWMYLRFQRKEQERFWETVFKATTHCGAGCTLGDILAEWLVFFLGIKILGESIWADLIGDFALAYILGIIFQFFTIAPMRKLGVKDGIVAAVKADTLSLIAFEVGLFAWMLLSYFVFFKPHLEVTDPVYWFMMQVGMGIGFLTSYPMNWFLVKKGLKEKM